MPLFRSRNRPAPREVLDDLIAETITLTSDVLGSRADITEAQKILDRAHAAHPAHYLEMVEATLIGALTVLRTVEKNTGAEDLTNASVGRITDARDLEGVIDRIHEAVTTGTDPEDRSWALETTPAGHQIVLSGTGIAPRAVPVSRSHGQQFLDGMRARDGGAPR